MDDLEIRLVALDLLIARNRSLRDKQESDFKKVKSYKGDHKASKDLFGETKRALKSAKAERKMIIAKLIKVQDAKPKK